MTKERVDKESDGSARRRPAESLGTKREGFRRSQIVSAFLLGYGILVGHVGYVVLLGKVSPLWSRLIGMDGACFDLNDNSSQFSSK